MGIRDTEDIIIKLNASYKVKHEKFKDFNESYFRDVYNQAAKIVKEIIDSGREDFDLDSIEGYTEPISNLIAFNGKRGSGKTSAMLSFCDFLRKYERYKQYGVNGVCCELLDMNQRVSFTVLDSIDATLVSEPKELIGAVLGKMLVAIKEKERCDLEDGKPQNIDIRKLKSKLGDIYQSMSAMDNMKDSTAAGEVLEQLGRSWNQQKVFRDAVRKFNDYMIQYKDSSKQNYLVIPVDDIDMNLEKGYQLLEAIRKYLMMPNVIVMLAADYMQLGKLCTITYATTFKEEESREKLAIEYLEKLIPTGRRIYMPELYPEEMLYNKRIMVQDEHGDILPIKMLILGRVWKYTGLMLNINSYNIHWLMPHSLRKLSNYINSMQLLTEFSENQDMDLTLTKNIRWFFDDLMSRYLSEKDLENEKYKTIVSAIEAFNNSALDSKMENLTAELTARVATPVTSAQYKIITYGTLLEKLFYTRKRDWNIELIEAVSFAVSLYLRTYICKIENAGEIAKQYKDDFLRLTHGDMWGDLEEIAINRGALYRVSVRATENISAKISKIFAGKGLTSKEKLIWGILAGLQEGEKGLEVSLRFGNFINISFDYENQLKRISELLCSITFSAGECRDIRSACQKMLTEYKEWEQSYHTTRVVPFDSMEFMYDLYEKLYDNEGVFANVNIQKEDNNYRYVFMQAVDVVEKTLTEYDLYYEKIREEYRKLQNCKIPSELTRSYKKVYITCPIIKAVKRSKNDTLFCGYSDLFAPSVPKKQNGSNDNATNLEGFGNLNIIVDQSK